MPQRGNISLYHGTVKKSQWHSFLLLSVSPLKSFVQTTGWALALFAGNEPFFSRLVDLLHFTCIFSLTFLQVKQKASRMEFRFRAKSGNKTLTNRHMSFQGCIKSLYPRYLCNPPRMPASHHQDYLDFCFRNPQPCILGGGGICMINMGVSKNRGKHPKMYGENNGKP